MQITLRKSFKYRIYPAKSQISALENQFSMRRYLYNWNLQERIETYEKERLSVTYNQQQNKLPELKKQLPWFKSVYSKFICYQVLQDVLKRLGKGFQSFFQRTKQGGVPGFAKFKKKGQWKSITYPQYKKHPFDIITVPKAGDIKMRCHRAIGESAMVKTLSITKDADNWFACFSVEHTLDIKPKQDLSSAIGIDLGLIDFVYDSDVDSMPAPRYFRKREKQLKRLHGKHVFGVPAQYTTHKCSACDKIVKKSLPVRTQRCPFRTFAANRDYNAVINILRIGHRYDSG
ncbi:MAG: transposase [Desulfobacteraceae bacterium]|nr:transposase [Desulfobacteraceae bacterium]